MVSQYIEINGHKVGPCINCTGNAIWDTCMRRIDKRTCEKVYITTCPHCDLEAVLTVSEADTFFMAIDEQHKAFTNPPKSAPSAPLWWRRAATALGD